jgi:hypothetical protein
MSHTVASLRQRAFECEQKAAWTKDEASRQSFLKLAQAWREMAHDYEELSKRVSAANSQSSTNTEAQVADDPLPTRRDVN